MPEREWGQGESGRQRLPRLEDLPRRGDGYDPQAVSDAFDAFYRRAAEWGPLPGRQTWASGYAVRASAERRGAFLEVAPRIAVEAAFIILVAVGAALADLGTTTVVVLVVAAWLVVALAEVLASLARPAHSA